MFLCNPRFYLYFLATLSLFAPLTATYAEEFPQLTILTEEWKPYNFYADGVVRGISTDMLVLMLDRVGSEQGRKDIAIKPWARAYKEVQDLSNTVLFSTTRTEERENMFKWVGPIFDIQFDIFALKSSNIRINSFEDLKKYSIGTLRGDVVEDMLISKAGMKIINFQQISSSINNTQKLAVGRVDLIPMTYDTLKSTSKEAGIDLDIFESVFILDKKSMYYAFNKDTPDSVIEILQKAFDDIKSEGKLTGILTEYGK